ncbi:MAG: nucleoside triphosphate pyrophosphohydrolase [Acidobacteria bacterium]|nr:nucleoside triphosphate pyrophosphohydrolase [Acidobacteriota bacterium]
MSRKFEDLVAVQARLRAPNGCPWDREQTHESLRTYLIEETYEVLDRLDAKEFDKLPEELGDLLLQVVFHSQLAQEAGRFEIGDVIESIHDKLVRRHPHVFGDVKADTSKQVLKNWEELKAEERKSEKPSQNGESILDGVPRTLPALLEAYQLTRRAANIGFDWQHVEEIFDKLKEETDELRRTFSEKTGEGNARTEEEVGDLLFVAVNIARFLKIDPEIALKKANRKFSSRFRAMEEAKRQQGSKLADASREEMENLWEQAKQKA